MVELLKELVDSKDYVEIYTNSLDISKFAFGRIIAFDESFFIAALISPSGNYDGLLLKPNDDIIKISNKTKYIEKMKVIIGDFIDQDYHFESNDLITQLLLYAKKKNCIISIELLHSGYDDITGLVDSVKKHQFVIKQVDQYGNDDGITYANKNDITQISFDSSKENSLLKLYKYNKNRS